MLTAIAIVVIVFLGIAVGLALLEQASGYVGDSSMVPALLMLMVIIVAGLLVFGWISGSVSIGFS